MNLAEHISIKKKPTIILKFNSFQKGYQHFIPLLTESRGEQEQQHQEEEFNEGTEDVHHPRGGVRVVLDPVQHDGHLGHCGQGGSCQGAWSRPGDNNHQL